MYITRVFLKRSPTPNVIHGILSKAFPGKRSETTNESLWRTDNLGDSKVLIIVSANCPDLHHIVSEIGVNKFNAENSIDCVQKDKTIDYEPFLKQIRNDQNWNFRLLANPIENIKQNPADKRGKIYALRSADEQIQWLERQSIKYGFIVRGCSVIGDSWIGFGKVRIRAVTYDGILTVTDADAFRLALSQGIGRGKAYGCGLITVARAQL